MKNSELTNEQQIENLYDLIDAYSKVRHLVDCGELVYNTHTAISLLKDEEIEVTRFARQCSVTEEGMNEGWVFGDGEKYAKYEHDALNIALDMGYRSINEAYEDYACYWTDWNDDESDWQYQLVDGKLIETED